MFAAYDGYLEAQDAHDYRAGIIAETIAASQGMKKDGGDPLRFFDWFPRLRPPEEDDPNMPSFTDADRQAAEIAHLETLSARERWVDGKLVVVEEKQTGE